MTNLTSKDIALANAIGSWGMLKKFPEDEITRAAIMRLVDKMASTPQQVEWLTDAVINNFNWWPGPVELRSLFCMRFKPADGHETSFDHNHPIAIEAERRAIEQSDRYKLIGSGEGARMIRQLIAGKVDPVESDDTEYAAQNERWYQVAKRWHVYCKTHGGVSKYQRVSKEFACAEVPRRAEILAEVERDLLAPPAKGGE